MKAKLTIEQDKHVAISYLSGDTVVGIAEKLGVYKQVVLNSLKRSNIDRRKDWKRASGYRNGKWRAGVRIIKKYFHVLIPNHPLARRDGYVPLHRLIASYKMGRQILPEEVVNHRDLDTYNNHPDNLEVFRNNGQHIAQHIRDGDFNRDSSGKFTRKIMQK